ncbi:MAG: DNA modification methylase, partial [Desulfuromonadaceae bacterium]|nr:DNA modification methylase [Desulfuromonadaceae bacterium]
VAGEARLAAAQKLSMPLVPVVRCEHLTDEQARAFRIADNKIAEDSSWIDDSLRRELQSLFQQDFDLSVIGFSQEGLDMALAGMVDVDGLTADDDVPELPEVPTSRPGDLWLLGDHRLMCGSATDPADALRLMAGDQIAMVFTDPPYNVNYQGKNKKRLTIQNDNLPSETFFLFLRDAFACLAQASAPGSAIYVCYADIESVNFRNALTQTGWLLKQNLIWVKNQFILGRQDYHWQHEPILYGWRAGGPHRWFGDRKQPTVFQSGYPVSIAGIDGAFQISIQNPDGDIVLQVPEYQILAGSPGVLGTIWRVDKPLSNDDHPTMKPVEVPLRAITNSSKRGDIVADFFGGSGSTLIACEKSSRRARIMELDPRYCDVIVKRWENFTGETAVLETATDNRMRA